MSKWFVSLFMKEQNNKMSQQNRQKAGTVGSVTGLAVNILLAVMKILLGTITGSVAVTADGFNNLSDAGGSLVALVSVRLAQKPYDKDHPFGHGRIEYLGALGVGVLIVVFAVELFKSAVESIIHPEMPVFSVVAVICLIAGILFKLFLWRVYRYIGTEYDNPAMIAAGSDSLSDVMATSAVLIAIVIAMLFGINLDGYIGLLVALLVLKAGGGVLKDMIDRLLGGKPDKELGKKVIDMLLSYDGINGIHDFVLHDYGPGRCMASVHAEVDADCNIVEIHEVIDHAESDILKMLNIPICIHMDPIVTGDEETEKIRKQITEFIGKMTPPLCLHDFRRVPGEKQVNLIFDVLLPPEVKNEKEINEKITAYAKELDPRHHCVIRYDRDYYSD